MRLAVLFLTYLLFAGQAGAGSLADGEAAFDRGDFEAAIQHYSAAIREGDHGSNGIGSIYYDRGLSYSRLGRNEEALTDYRQALETGYQHPNLHSSTCYTLSDRLKQHDEALPYCNEALRMDPAHGPTYSIRALIWWRKGNISEAERDFEHALSLDPDNWRIIYNRGTMYHVLNRRDDAEADFRRFANMAPDWALQRMASRLAEYGLP